MALLLTQQVGGPLAEVTRDLGHYPGAHGALFNTAVVPIAPLRSILMNFLLLITFLSIIRAPGSLSMDFTTRYMLVAVVVELLVPLGRLFVDELLNFANSSCSPTAAIYSLNT